MHHSRRKSGHGSANTSMTDVRKAAVTASDPSRYSKRPSTGRKTTPQSAGKSSKSSRDREYADEYYDEESESFPQYCMTCEKQFITNDDRYLYCSEACRKGDGRSSSSRSHSGQQQGGNYPFYSAGNPEPRDIIPRASPSRPNSMAFSSPSAANWNHHQQTQSAISSLRQLSIRPQSPPSPSSTTGGHWPFTRSAATSPSTSYTRGTSGFFSSTYDGGYGAGNAAAAAAHGGYNFSSSGMERPLPARRPGGYSRPKSIELVTPMVGR